MRNERSRYAFDVPVHGNFDSRVISTGELGYPAQVGFVNSYSPQIYYFNGKTYFVWYSSVAQGTKSYISYYNHLTKEVAESVLVHTPDNQDSHAIPAMIIANDGSIIVVAEKLDNTHPNSVNIYKSDSVEDISAFTLITNVGNATDKVRCYPNLYKVGSRIYLVLRSARPSLYLYYSDDNGSTWVGGIDGTEIVDLTTDWAYMNYACPAVNDKIRIIVSEKLFAATTNRYCYYLESTNGDTWTNIQGTYSHTISVDGVVTQAILRTNYLVRNTGGVTISNVIDASCIYNNVIYFLVRTWVVATGTITPYLRYWDGGQWIERQIPVTSSNYGGDIIAYSKDVIDVFLAVEGHVNRIRTEDGGDTWNVIQIFEPTKYEVTCSRITYNRQIDIPICLGACYQNNGTTSSDILFATPSPASVAGSSYVELRRARY